jgi:nitroreductase
MTTSVSYSRALRQAVRAAVLAPSVHNTQPWRFVLRPGQLDVYADRARRLPVLDPTGRQMYLSIGCAAFNARVSIASQRLGLRVARCPDAEHAELVTRLVVDPGEPWDEGIAGLEPVIELRQTNRRRFTTDPVPQDLVTTLQQAAAAEHAVLEAITDPDHRAALARLSQRADELQLTNAAYRAELRAWTTDDPNRLDGVRSAVVPHVDGSAQDDLPLRDFDTHGKGWLPPDTRSSLDQCLLVLGTESDGPRSWLRGGEALERVWLEITRAGFAASLFTQVIEVPALRVELRRELSLGIQPHVVLRVGRAPVTPSTLRRHLADVLVDDIGESGASSAR